MLKPAKLLTLAGCLALAALGGVLPFVGWLFLVAALHVLVSEFETGRGWIRGARRRWPFLSRQIVRARRHPWAPGRLHKFDELTDPLRNA
ncbi:MAG: hypothetical protein JOY81_10760 [Alphaproteobacteria bacterium]|nr:hypothetical protein [Alphaproteobacteria bacterium]